MKKIIIFALIFLGCSPSNQPVGDCESGNWCYLESGLYLVCGDYVQAYQWREDEKNDWPRCGHVEDVFDTYNDDDNLEMFHVYDPPIERLWEYQADGYRVVIIYWTSETMRHARPMIKNELYYVDVVEACVAGYF